MTPFDAVMIGLVVAGMVWGAIRGITWQVASLASLVLGYAGAMSLSGQIAPHLPGQPIVARAASMLVAYVGISAGIFGVAWVVRAMLRRLKFEAYDRHLGMLLGGAEGALLGIVLTVFVLSLAPGTRKPILGSLSGRAIGAVLGQVGPVLPGEIRAELGPLWGDGAGRPAAEEEGPSGLAGEWEELKRPLELARGREAAGDTPQKEAEGEASEPEPGATREGHQVAERGAEADRGEGEASLGRVVADTIDEGLGRVGEKKGREKDSRRRRIGRAVAEMIGEEIDRLGERSDGERNSGRR